MAVYALGDLVPCVDADCYVHPDAVIIGKVSLGEGSSVWPGAVLRGDFGSIVVGAGTSVQDGTIVHAGMEHPTVVGRNCTVGHGVHLEGCEIGDRCLVGSMSTVMRGVKIGDDCIVAAGSVVTNNTVASAGEVLMGAPAEVVDYSGDRSEILKGPEFYMAMAKRYNDSLRRIS